MISIILFDVDGVLIRPTEYYSRILSRKGFIEAPTQIDAFYKTDMPCTVGKEDPLIRIREYLDNMLWEKSAQEYFDEQFAFEKQFVDNELLDGISRLRSSGIQCYLATDQNHYRKKFLLEDLAFAKKFDGWFVSADLGYRKINNEYWQNVKSQYQVNNNDEVLFVDDRIENIKVAEQYGITGFYISSEAKIVDLNNLINELVVTRFTKGS